MYPPTHSWKSEDSSSTLNTGTQWVRGSTLTKHQLMMASSITQQCSFWLLFLQPSLCTNQSWDKATGLGGKFCSSSAKKKFPVAKKAKKMFWTPRKQLFLLHLSLDKVGPTRHHIVMKLQGRKTFLRMILKGTHLSCIGMHCAIYFF